MANKRLDQLDSITTPTDGSFIWTFDGSQAIKDRKWTLTSLVTWMKTKLSTVSDTGNHSDLMLDDGTNPHGTTQTDVGLGDVDNTSDLDKPVSLLTQQALEDLNGEALALAIALG